MTAARRETRRFARPCDETLEISFEPAPGPRAHRPSTRGVHILPGMPRRLERPPRRGGEEVREARGSTGSLQRER